MALTLADAIIQQNISYVREMLHMGVELNDWDEYGFTPIIEAILLDNLEMTQLLISFGADVNLKDATGNTPLYWAVENYNMKICELLLQHGADANAYNFAGQSILVTPLLRQQAELKKLLFQYGASLAFAQDYINLKLLGHMFELVGSADIVDPKGQFVEVDFEGFFLEFSLGVITESVSQFQNHYAARQLRRYIPMMQMIVDVISRGTQFIKYQQYPKLIPHYQNEIVSLMQKEPLLIPVGYEGHAITFIKFGQIFVKCDRREDSRLYDNVYFYHINHPKHANIDFFQELIYKKQTEEFVNEELPNILGLQPITELKVSAQISGNCSWANVEAAIPAIFFLLCSTMQDFQKNISQYKNLSLSLFDQWREWNKDRALNFCIQSFKYADTLRRLCKAEILAAILYQACAEETPKNRERTETILSVLMQPEFNHILQNYVKSYCYEDYSEQGKHFLKVLKSHGFVEKK